MVSAGLAFAVGLNGIERTAVLFKTRRIIIYQQAVCNRAARVGNKLSSIIQPRRGAAVQPRSVGASKGLHCPGKLAEIGFAGGGHQNQLIGPGHTDSRANARREMHAAAKALVAGIYRPFAVDEQTRPCGKHGLIVAPVISPAADERHRVACAKGHCGAEIATVDKLTVDDNVPGRFKRARAEKSAVDCGSRSSPAQHRPERLRSADAVFCHQRGYAHVWAVQIGRDNMHPYSGDLCFSIRHISRSKTTLQRGQKQ